jgi:myo-inositol-1(or 4)-monophosphatase
MSAAAHTNRSDAQLAEKIAREAGELILAGERERDGERPAVTATKSSPTDVVTAMDRAVEELLRRRLAQRRPGDAVLGEEAGLHPAPADAGGGRTWVLDPIDGTVNYLYRIPAYAVSVALVTGDPAFPGAWRPLAGCVHQPATGLTWTAAAGEGAWLGGRRLHLGQPPALGQALVATGFGYQQQRRAAQARVLAGVLPAVRDIRRIGSAALDLCAVATGTVDAYYERGVNVWDIAAAALVLTEAGGRVSGVRGAPAGPDLVLAAGEPLFGALEELLAGLDADRD